MAQRLQEGRTSFAQLYCNGKETRTWSRKTSGPHHIGWSPRGHFESIDPPHPSGVLAASNILDTLARAPSSSLQVLPFWLEDLTVNKQLSELLQVHRRLLDLLDGDLGNCEPVVRVKNPIAIL